MFKSWFWKHSMLQGILEVLFGQVEGSGSCSLISEGAECILINKQFFIKYLTEATKSMLKKSVSFRMQILSQV